MAKAQAEPTANGTSGDATDKAAEPGTIPVSVRFSQVQLQCVDSEAEQQGIDRSNFIRAAALAETSWDPQGVGKIKVADRLAEISARLESLERTILNLSSLVLAQREKV